MTDSHGTASESPSHETASGETASREGAGEETRSQESEHLQTTPGNSADNVSDAGGVSGELRGSPEVGGAEEAASQESRRLAEAEGTET